jgi:tetratricopeptide (TPR) repeat protein
MRAGIAGLGAPGRLAAAALILLAFSVTLTGCGPFLDYARVLDANRLHNRGDYQEAIAAYAKSGRKAFRATIDYDQGNSYARLGEYGRAAKLYASAKREAEPTGERALVADSLFNEGVAAFERGAYEESWRLFRAALKGSEPRSPFACDARRNLELAWRAWKKSSLAPPQGASATRLAPPEGAEQELWILQKLENGRWRPGSPQTAPSRAADY